MSDSPSQKRSRPSQKTLDQGHPSTSGSNPGPSGDSGRDRGTIGSNPSAEVSPSAAAPAGASSQSARHSLPTSSRTQAQKSALTQALMLPPSSSLANRSTPTTSTGVPQIPSRPPTQTSESPRPGLAPIPSHPPTQKSALTQALRHPTRSLTPQELIDLAFPSPSDPRRSVLPSGARVPTKQSSTGEDAGPSSSEAAGSKIASGGASRDAVAKGVAARGGDFSRPTAKEESATGGVGSTGANRTRSGPPDDPDPAYVMYTRELELLEEIVERAMYEIECLAQGQPLTNPKYQGIPSSQIYSNASAKIADGKHKIAEVERRLREMGVSTRPPGPDRFSTARFRHGHAPGDQDVSRSNQQEAVTKVLAR